MKTIQTDYDYNFSEAEITNPDHTDEQQQALREFAETKELNLSASAEKALHELHELDTISSEVMDQIDPERFHGQTFQMRFMALLRECNNNIPEDIWDDLEHCMFTPDDVIEPPFKIIGLAEEFQDDPDDFSDLTADEIQALRDLKKNQGLYLSAEAEHALHLVKIVCTMNSEVFFALDPDGFGMMQLADEFFVHMKECNKHMLEDFWHNLSCEDFFDSEVINSKTSEK